MIIENLDSYEQSTMIWINCKNIETTSKDSSPNFIYLFDKILTKKSE